MKKRYYTLDLLRGLAIINMIMFHAMWDIVYIFKVDIPWFKTDSAHIWQQCICWNFILLSGFCWSFGKRKLKNALVVLGASVIITAVTTVFMKSSIIIFGVLCSLGSSMLLMIPLEKLLKRINPFVGFALFFFAFLSLKNVQKGYVGIGGHEWLLLPSDLYENYFTAYLGFPFKGFYSSDYFPLIPWMLLFMCGYYLYLIFCRYNLLRHLSSFRCKPFEFMGRHSLVIYMIHQPVVYGVLFLIFCFV